MPRHGTFYGYTSGCRCKKCRQANREHRTYNLTNGTFGVRIGARWAAISVRWLHPMSMEWFK